MLCVAFSPDGRWLASADSGGVVKIWDAARGDEIPTPVPLEEPTQSTVTSVAFSPDGQLFAAGGLDRTIRVWDASRWGTRATAPPEAPLHAPAPEPGQRRRVQPRWPNGLAAAYDDHTVRAWDLPTRTIRLILRGHVDAVSSVAFSPDGWRLASASQDETDQGLGCDPGSPDRSRSAIIRTRSARSARSPSAGTADGWPPPRR